MSEGERRSALQVDSIRAKGRSLCCRGLRRTEPPYIGASLHRQVWLKRAAAHASVSESADSPPLLGVSSSYCQRNRERIFTTRALHAACPGTSFGTRALCLQAGQVQREVCSSKTGAADRTPAVNPGHGASRNEPWPTPGWQGRICLKYKSFSAQVGRFHWCRLDSRLESEQFFPKHFSPLRVRLYRLLR